MSETPEAPVTRRRRRFAPLMIVAGLASAVVLSLSMTNTLSAFVASVTNSNDTAAAGSVILQETGPGSTGAPVTCSSNDGSLASNSFSCTTINKYGGSTTMIPSNTAGTTNTVTTTVSFVNKGTALAGSFTLTPSACQQTGTGTVSDACSKFNVKVVSGGTTLYSGTMAAFTAAQSLTVPTPNSGSTVSVTFTVWLDNSAGNAYQGLGVTQPLVWTLTSA